MLAAAAAAAGMALGPQLGLGGLGGSGGSSALPAQSNLVIEGDGVPGEAPVPPAILAALAGPFTEAELAQAALAAALVT